MINALRRIFPPRVGAGTTTLLIECLQRLPPKTYERYVKQVEEGLLKYEGYPDIEHPAFKNYVNFTYEPRVSGRYQDPKGRFWRLRNILVKNRTQSSTTNLSIFISHGLVCGYAFEAGRDFDPDPESIDVSKATSEFFDSPDPIVKSLISPTDQDLVVWSDVYEVEIDGVKYFHLKDIGDGDFVGVDENGLLFEFRHDPFELFGLEGSLHDILERY